MADRLIVKLKELGFEVEKTMLENISEETPETYSISSGRSSGRSGPLSGHMDTVEPSKARKGIIGEDGVIRSAGKSSSWS